jgi:hypothetical protein
VLSGLDFVRVKVEVQEVLQGQRVAKITSTCVYLGLGGPARALRLNVLRLNVHTTVERTEAR